MTNPTAHFSSILLLVNNYMHRQFMCLKSQQNWAGSLHCSSGFQPNVTSAHTFFARVRSLSAEQIVTSSVTLQHTTTSPRTFLGQLTHISQRCMCKCKVRVYRNISYPVGRVPLVELAGLLNGTMVLENTCFHQAVCMLSPTSSM
jgi:hypothetical protein